MFGALIFTKHTVCKLLEFREHRHETYVAQLRREGKLHQIKRTICVCRPAVGLALQLTKDEGAPGGALKIASFYLRAICCNRIMWGDQCASGTRRGAPLCSVTAKLHGLPQLSARESARRALHRLTAAGVHGEAKTELTQIDRHQPEAIEEHRNQMNREETSGGDTTSCPLCLLNRETSLH
jgi:hypothetical protein